MKRLLIILSLLPCFAVGQNLVPNPSFEDTIYCPCTTATCFDILNDWTSFSWSPDYYNACNPSSPFNGVPSNAFGYQFAATGNAYCGFYAYADSSFYTDYRECIGAPLTATLSIGQKYYLSMKVSFTHSYLIGNDACAANRLGILLTTQPYDWQNRVPINNFSHVRTDSRITDSLNWTLIFGSVVADSNYQYVVIGNFFEDDSTTLTWSNTPCVAYYYVDDVCVSTDSLFCQEFVGVKEQQNEQVLNVYPNPTSGKARIMNVESAMLNEVQVVDLFGRPVPFSIQNSTLNIQHLPSGIYIVKVGNSTTKLILTR